MCVGEPAFASVFETSSHVSGQSANGRCYDIDNVVTGCIKHLNLGLQVDPMSIAMFKLSAARATAA